MALLLFCPECWQVVSERGITWDEVEAAASAHENEHVRARRRLMPLPDLSGAPVVAAARAARRAASHDVLLVACARCGHRHWNSHTRQYEPCPATGCDCLFRHGERQVGHD